MAVLLRRLQEIDSSRRHCFSRISTSDHLFLPNDDLYSPFPERKHRVVGYCNGLFCLQYDDGEILLWNPSTGEFKLLNLPDLEVPPCPFPNCAKNCKPRVNCRISGLGFAPKSGDYKVVSFVTVFYATDTDGKDFDHGYLKRVELYSLKDNCWNEVIVIYPPGEKMIFEKYDIVDECATYVNGFCYWKARRRDYERVIIVSFDLSEEKFATLRLPEPGHSIYRFDSILLEFKRCLGVVIYFTLIDRKLLYPWVRVINDGRPRWTRKMGFKVSVEVERPLGYCGDGGELLLLEGFDGKLLIYDSIAQELNKFEIYDHPHTMQLFPHVESTVSLSTFDANTANLLATPCDTNIPARPSFSKRRKKEMLKSRKGKILKRRKRRKNSVKEKSKILKRRKKEKKTESNKRASLLSCQVSGHHITSYDFLMDNGK